MYFAWVVTNTHTCHLNLCQTWAITITSERFLVPLPGKYHPHSPQAFTFLITFLLQVSFAFPAVHVSAVTQWALFCVTLNPLDVLEIHSWYCICQWFLPIVWLLWTFFIIWITDVFIHSCIGGNLGCFQGFLYVNKATMNIDTSFCERVFLFLLGKSLVFDFLGYRVCLC